MPRSTVKKGKGRVESTVSESRRPHSSSSSSSSAAQVTGPGALVLNNRLVTQEEFFCPLCDTPVSERGEIFHNKKEFTAHFRRSHANVTLVLTCGTCEKNFGTAKQLAEHLNWHEAHPEEVSSDSGTELEAGDRMNEDNSSDISSQQGANGRNAADSVTESDEDCPKNSGMEVDGDDSGINRGMKRKKTGSTTDENEKPSKSCHYCDEVLPEDQLRNHYREHTAALNNNTLEKKSSFEGKKRIFK